MRIVVIRFSSLGDLVLLLPMLSALRDGFPEAVIDMVTRASFAELFEGNTDIDSVITLEEGSMAETSRLASQLNENRYSIAIDAHNVARSRFIFNRLNVPTKVRLKKEGIKKFLLINFKLNLYEKRTRLIERYGELVQSLGLEGFDPIRPMKLSAAHESRADSMIDEFGLKAGDIVALAPGSKWKTKRWPAERFAEVTRMLYNMGLSPVLIGGVEDIETCRKVKILSSVDAKDISGKTSVLETAAMLKKIRFLITNDSAALHIAESVGTPVIAIFGPTVEEFGYFPRLQKSIVLQRKLWCRPCSRTGSRRCILGSRPCLTGIEVDDVLEAATRLADETSVQTKQ